MQAPEPIKHVAALLAGALLPLAYAPFDAFWLAPLAYAALLFLWRGASPGRAFRLGFLFGCASFLAGIYWVYISIHDFGQAHFLLAAAVTIALVVTLALFIGFVGYAAARWFSTSGGAAWFGVLPALWVLTEWVRGWFLSGFGWLAAGYSQSDSWLMAYAPVFGIHGMSWAVLLTAGAVLGLLLGAGRTRAAAAALLSVVWLGTFFLDGRAWTAPRGNVLTVALLQGAVPQEMKWRPEQAAATLALYRELTHAADGSRLIVWPEAAIPLLYEQVTEYLAEIRAWAEQRGSTVLLGILRRDSSGTTFENAVVALTEPPAFYVKRHLVPFGEYFPVPRFIRSWMRLQSLPYTDAATGNDSQPPLDLAGESIGVTICYEDVFGAEQLHYLPQATLLVNVSNDAWFGDSIAPHQHLQIARVRAAEAGRYLLRSTNTGISAIIDPRGRIVVRSPQFEPHVLKGVVQGFTGRTPYAFWGNYPVVVGAALLLLLLQLPRTKFTIRPGT